MCVCCVGAWKRELSVKAARVCDERQPDAGFTVYKWALLSLTLRATRMMM